MQRILIITYYWPPAGGPGVQRWLKFTKYLVKKGYDVHVYVPENPSYPIVDEALIQEIPDGAHVVKQPILEPYNLASILGKKKVKTISSGVVPSDEKQSLKERLMLWIRGNIFVPDARVLWVKPSTRFLKQYIEDNNIPIVITSGPPHSLHLIGAALKKSSAVRWLADFRDPWTTIEYHDKLKLSHFAQRKHKAMERMVLQSADDIIVTSPLTKVEFDTLTNRPVHVITNGYDTEVHQRDDLDSKFTMAHIGSLLAGRNPEILWKAISELNYEEESFARDARLTFIGVVSDAVLETISQYGIAHQVDALGYLPHSEVVAYQAKSQVLLLIEANNPVKRCILPGKVFEYMSAGRPILAFGVPDSDIQSIIEASEAGSYFNYSEAEAVKEQLRQYYRAFRLGNLSVSSKGVNVYHRSVLTDALIEVLETPSHK